MLLIKKFWNLSLNHKIINRDRHTLILIVYKLQTNQLFGTNDNPPLIKCCQFKSDTPNVTLCKLTQHFTDQVDMIKVMTE